MKPPLQCGKKKGKPTAAATAAHRRYLSSSAATTLHGKMEKVSCSGFLPKTKPMQHSCSYYFAFRSITWQLTRISLRTWQQSMTTIMQPFHCDLQPQIQETHRTTHIDTTTRCRTRRSNQFCGKPVWTHMATKRDNNHVAIPLRSATTDSKIPYNYARTSTPKAA